MIRLQPCTLPVLSNVQFLDITGYLPRRLAPSVGTDLAAALPNVKSITWEFCDYDDQSASLRSDDRATFAEALRHVRIQRRSSANIVIQHEWPFDQRLAGRNIVSSGLSYDPFSAALRILSQNLTSLTVSAHLDSTLFWPSYQEENIVAPFWPFLRNLDVNFDMVTPFGDWYFTGVQPAHHENDDPTRGVVGGNANESDYTKVS